MTDFDEIMLNQELKIGDIVGDTQRIVVDCKKIRDRVPGDSYASWVAICAKHDEFHQYVVWYVYATRKGFHAEMGDYYHTLSDAIYTFNKRVSKS